MSEGSFGLCYRMVMSMPGLSIQAKALYALLTTFADKERTCFPSVKTLCGELDCSDHTFRKYRTELVTCGILEVMPQYLDGKQVSNRYRLNDRLPPASSVGATPANYAGVGTEKCAGRPPASSEGGTDQSTDQSTNQSSDHRNTPEVFAAEICAILNSKRTGKAARGRIKPTGFGLSVIQNLLFEGYTENQILTVAQNGKSVDWIDLVKELRKRRPDQ